VAFILALPSPAYPQSTVASQEGNGHPGRYLCVGQKLRRRPACNPCAECLTMGDPVVAGICSCGVIGANSTRRRLSSHTSQVFSVRPGIHLEKVTALTVFDLMAYVSDGLRPG
jgi:hypothetical protein